MAALLCSFNNDGKSFAGLFKDFHFGKAHRHIRQIIIKKVSRRMKQFTTLHIADAGETLGYLGRP
jgi:hypothetical protein